MKTPSLIVRKIVYGLCFIFDEIFNRSKNHIVVIALHSFSTATWKYSIPMPKFEKIVQKLIANKYNFIKLKEFENVINQKTKIKGKYVLITIDDGYQDNLELVRIAEKYKIQPILFIITSRNSVNTKELGTSLPLLTENDVVGLFNKGWVVGSHGLTHSNLCFLDEASLSDELIKSRRYIEHLTSSSCACFSYPKGNTSAKIQEHVKKSGYSMAFGMNDSLINCFKFSKFEIPRVGLDSTHGVWEAICAISPTAIIIRGIVKNVFSKSLIERYI